MADEQPRRWRPAGWVDRGRRQARIFEALVAISCSQCQRPILPGELFSRVVVNRTANFRLPLCQSCLPFADPVVS
jgi:hypothetical protein